MILDGHAPASIALAVERIRGGGLVGLPTETVYGLAGDADNAAAVGRIFATKGRPPDHPLIVHVPDAPSAMHFASRVPEFARRLMAAFWPGPLTLILHRRHGVAAAAAGGQDSVGLRCPAHPVAQALLRACHTPGAQGAQGSMPVWGLAAPSANQFGRVSPTTAQHVASEFDSDLLILNGGACSVGIESTIIDCTRAAAVLLRPGVITLEQVQAVCRQKVFLAQEFASGKAPHPRASGTLVSHYAPRARVYLMEAREIRAALDKFASAPEPDRAGAASIAIYSRQTLQGCSTQAVTRRMPDDAAATARQLFAVLREFDRQGVAQIWIETPPQGAAWEGVRDRLLRASAIEA